MRQRPFRPKAGRKIVLIQCEGSRTEYAYLDDFCRDCGARHVFTIDVNPGRGQNAVVTVETAMAKIKSERTRGKVYDEVWCVMDVEHAAHGASLTAALAFAKKHNIKVCLSNPSFEVWLLAHFERVKRDFPDSAAVERRLSDVYWKKHFDCEYDKGDARLYERLAPLRDDAVDNAQWVLETLHGDKPCREANASTEVYQLVGRLVPE